MTVAFSRRARWAVPAGAAAVVAAAATASAITVAQAAPALHARTPAQLLAAVAGQTAPPPPLTGTVVENAALGIPQLPGAANPTSVTSLLTGSHTIKVWYADPTHFRLAAPVTMGESDLIRNGGTVWFWQSSSNSVTRVQMPAGPPGMPREHAAPKTPLTPQQAASQVLAAVGPTTRVSLQNNVVVAGQAAYQLVLAPRDSRSQVGKVTIALDGQHPGVPLRVQVFARGATAPAFSVGYTSISFVRPAAANFRFTPPAGAHVQTLSPGRWNAYPPMAGQGFAPPGGGWTGYAPLRPGTGHPVIKMVKGKMVVVKGGRTYPLPVGARDIPHARQIMMRIGKRLAGQPPAVAAPGAMAPRFIGKGWLTVAVLPQGALAGLGHGNAASAAGQAARSVSGNGGQVNNAAIMAALLEAAHPVHGSWGSGRLLHTSLLSILITGNGHVLVGAVSPSVLYADAAQVK